MPLLKKTGSNGRLRTLPTVSGLAHRRVTTWNSSRLGRQARGVRQSGLRRQPGHIPQQRRVEMRRQRVSFIRIEALQKRDVHPTLANAQHPHAPKKRAVERS